MKISLLLPTRNRPDDLGRFVESARSLANQPNKLEIVAYIDNDDASYDNILADLRIEVVRGGRIVLSQMWNECWAVATGEIYGHMGDDIVFRTQGWDDLVREEFEKYPDRLVLVHGDDGHHKETFGTHCFVHKNYTDLVGRFLPPYFPSDYNDTWLNDVFNVMGRRVYIPALVTEHMHWTFGKHEKDQTHEDRIARHRAANVEQMYALHADERQMEVELLRGVIK